MWHILSCPSLTSSKPYLCIEFVLPRRDCVFPIYVCVSINAASSTAWA